MAPQYSLPRSKGTCRAIPPSRCKIHFGGAAVKLRKASLSFVMSVRPSSWNNSAHTGRIFVKTWYLSIFPNFGENTIFVEMWEEWRVLDMKTDVQYIHCNISLNSSYNEKIVVERPKTHILCSTNFYSENRVVCELMWKHVLEPDRPQMPIQ